MRRRAVIKLLGTVLVVPKVAGAQGRKIPTVGILWHAGSAEEEGAYYKGMLQGFEDLGYYHGVNIILEHRFPNEQPELFRTMVRELIALNVDVLVTVGTQTAPYAKEATKTIPVVFLFVPDPVGSSFVDSIARPGKNMTGLSNFGRDILAKRLQFLKEMKPSLSRVALLVNPNTQVASLYKSLTDAAADELGLENHTFEARSLAEFEPAFNEMANKGMQAVTINGEGVVYQHRVAVAKLALTRHLLLGVWSRETFEGGALLSYGSDQVALSRRTPVFVDRILRGTKVGEIPVEQPTKLELLINLKVARALHLTVPQALLALADEVIE